MAARRVNGMVLDIMLLSAFLFLVYVFVQRRGYLQTSGSPKPQQRPFSKVFNQNGAQRASSNIAQAASAQVPVVLTQTPKLGGLVDPRIEAITDVRPAACRDRRYDVQQTVSVVIDFFDYQFFDLKTTLGSVLAHTPAHFIREIIIIDDGSTLDYIVKEADAYVVKLPNARMLRNGVREGVTRARRKGAALATAPVLVFLDTSVVCAQGWLEPLLQLIDSEKSAIAVPHYDSINDPVSYDYKSTAHNLVTSFSWRLNVRMVERSKANDVTAPLASPVMRGNAFAVGKGHFETLGGYDEGFTEAGGENLELSLRAWMCGGSVKVLPCSRVGVLNLNDPIRVGSKSNIRRIAELWLGNMKEFVYRQTDSARPASTDETTSLEVRRRHLAALQCRNLDWYVSKVAAGLLYKPSGGDVVDYGYLRVFNGLCASPGNDSRIDLSACSFGVSMVMRHVFELHDDGRLMIAGQCLTVTSSAYVLAEDCARDDDHQKWKFNDQTKVFVNRWSQNCLMHVTDPDPKPGKRQIAMAQDCEADRSKDKVFVKWEFVRL
ncbi:Polypeptide N-acetylgalactosaminyltransferase 4 [Lamellibrachia satsuma]|nr:Polypeptide N-acetylgalactosaminyltransferase 4 [Lamellibrachia satsuma]